PVILGVDARQWLRDEQPERTTDPDPEKEGHAVVVVGYRVTGPLPGDVAWLVHDPGDRPFVPRRLADCLEAAWGCAPAGGGPGRLVFLPVADERVGVHLPACVDWLRDRRNQDHVFRRWVEHARALGYGPTAERELGRMAEAFEDYVNPPAGGRYHLRAGLVDPAGCRPFFETDGARDGAVTNLIDHLIRQIETLPGRRYWCLAGYQAADAQPPRVRHIWLFDAEAPGLANPTAAQALALALYVDAEVVTLRRPTYQAKPPVPLRPVPAPVPCADPAALAPAVMTSCSTRPLAEFVAEVREVGGAARFDLILLRETDLDAFRRSLDPGYKLPAQSRHAADPANPVTRFLADADPARCDQLADWIAAQLPPRGPDDRPVAALATYLPGVTSLTAAHRADAVRALANCVRVGLSLQARGRMREVVVELVCGSILDRCGCPACARANPHGHPRCHVSDRGQKVELLVRSLREVVAAVAAGGAAPRFALGLELEPGPTYVLNDIDAIDRLMALSSENPLIRDHVGLNIDIAHMRIAGIAADRLAPWRDRIVHAHVADHPPGMHTRDQPPGTWTPVYTPDSPYHPYVRLLADRARAYEPGHGLPFSGAVALELEGCDRIDWVYQGVPAVHHRVRFAQNWA
ncbi:MAG TPA: hypothetical protein VH092_19060, partial [Urbifossiella sp.]|nr:hypothetical protein [Urbifossiella sp.]